MRKTGIDIIGDVPWGMHLCQFYQSKEDLLDILVPYFKAGLENNEFCVWVTSEPLSEKEAKKAMRKAVPDFDYYLEKGHIEIIPYSEWYLKDDAFNLKRVLNGWIDKLNDALAKGFEGMRVTGNTTWLEKRDWRNFADYEKEVNHVIGKYRMIAICTYSLDKCGAVELIDVVGNHQFALIRREGKWELMENSERKQVEQELKESEERFRSLFEESNDAVFIHGLDGGILNVNARACEMLGYDKDTLLQMPIVALHPQEELPRSKKAFETTKDKGSVRFESKFKKADGTIINVDISSRITDPEKGVIQGIARDITEHEQAEQALRESESKYRSLFENMRNGFAYCRILLDENNRPTDFVYLEINDAFERLTGLKKENVVGKKATEAIPGIKNSHPELLDIYGKVALTGKETEFDIYFEPLGIWLSISVYSPGKGYFVAVFDNITEPKKAEQVLRESEERYRVLAETAQDFIYLISPDMHLKYVNTAGTRQLEARPEDIIGRPLNELFPPEVYERQHRNLKRVFQTGEQLFIEEKYPFPAGEVWLSVRLVPVTNRQGEITAVLDVSRDITERKKIEQEIAFLSRFPSENPNPVLRIATDGRILYANDPAKEVFKVQVGKKMPERYFPILKKATSSKEYVNFEEEVGGRYFSSVVRAIPKTGYLNMYSKDITERKKVEDALEESEERYRTLFQDAAEGILVTDIETKQFKYANPALCRMLGYTEEELQGMGVADIHPKDHLEHVISEFEAQVRGEKTLSPNIACLRKDGTTVYVDINATHALVDGRQCNVGFLTDITERKKAEKALIRSEKLRALGEMAGGVAHDFNNVLAIILGNAQLLEKGLERYKSEEIKERLKIIAQTAYAGGGTVRRLQYFTQRGVSAHNFAKLDLNEIVRDAIASTSPRWKDEAGAKGIRIKIKEELGELPALWGSRSELMEVLTNLIFNALDAMSKGGEITVKTEAKEKEVLLYFTDSGKGIAKRIKDKIFEPFFTTKGPKASGLGLSVSYGIVKRHQGDIKMGNAKKEGTTFIISIPISSGAASEKEKVAVPKKIFPNKILVVDDEAGIGEVLKTIFQDEGHRVVLVKSAREGLDKFKQDKLALAFTGFEDKFDLVLTDLGMSGMSGWQLAKEIKQIDPDMPVGLITGWTVPTSRKKMKEQGVDFVLCKPFDYTEVLREVNAVFKSNRRQPSPPKNKQRPVSAMSTS